MHVAWPVHPLSLHSTRIDDASRGTGDVMEQVEQRSSGTVRLAAVGDVHCTKHSQGALLPIFASVAEQADVLVLCGDLCDYGLPEEAHILVRELSSVRVPIVAVLGNHDFESGQQDAVKRDPLRGRRPGAGRRRHRDQGRRLRRRQGVRRRIRQASARSVGRERDQGVRPRGDRRGAEARKRRRAAARGAQGRAAALLADPGDLRGRAAGDHAVPGVEPAGGAAQSLPGQRRRSTATPITAASKAAPRPTSRLQRLGAAAAAPLPGSTAVSGDRDPARRRAGPGPGRSLDGANHREREVAPMA